MLYPHSIDQPSIKCESHCPSGVTVEVDVIAAPVEPRQH